MTQEATNINPELNNDVSSHLKIDDFLEDDDVPTAPAPQQPKEKKLTLPPKEMKKEPPVKKETEEDKKEKYKSFNNQNDEKDENEKSIDWRKEAEKIQDNLKQTRRWGEESNRKLAAYKKAVEKFKESGALDVDEAEELLNHAKYQDAPDKGKTFYDKAGEVWDREIENIRKYSDYEDLDKHLHAFRYFAHNGDPAEIDDFYEEVKDLIDSNPILFTKKMLEAGRRYHDEIFSDLLEAGNLKNFKRKYEDKIGDYQKKIDKLEKEIQKYKNKYEDYDENPNYNFPQSGNNKGMSIKEDDDDIGLMLKKHNMGKYRNSR